MRVRSKSNLVFRRERFGMSVYVPERDDIFLLDEQVSNLLDSIGPDWTNFSSKKSGLDVLASLGIIEAVRSSGTPITQRGYSGIHLIGKFLSTPIVERPLLVNCFATSWCPLKCVYCHADDLMDPKTRENEHPDQINDVAEVAKNLDALVYVVTGGDPLTRPERTLALINMIPFDAAVVLDTSGVGQVDDMVRILEARSIHVRVSVDSMNPRINQKLRPLNKKIFPELAIDGRTSLDYVEKMLVAGLELGAGVSVQTVVTKHNDSLRHMLDLRDWLLSRGVRNWVLHIATNAGMANKAFVAKKKKLGNETNAGIFPSPNTSRILRKLVDLTMDEGIDMDIRTTNASPTPNSVFLVGSVGSLFVQGFGPGRVDKKRLSFHQSDISGMWGTFSDAGHVSRYTNLDIFEGPQSMQLDLE